RPSLLPMRPVSPSSSSWERTSSRSRRWGSCVWGRKTSAGACRHRCNTSAPVLPVGDLALQGGRVRVAALDVADELVGLRFGRRQIGRGDGEVVDRERLGGEGRGQGKGLGG